MNTLLLVVASIAFVGVIAYFALRFTRGAERRKNGEVPDPTRGFYVVVIVVFVFFVAAGILKLTGR